MTLYTLIFLIAVSIVFVYDWVDFPHNFVARILSFIYKKPFYPDKVYLPKIFECSLCATFWTTLITILCIDYHYAFLSILAAFSTKYIYYTIKVLDTLISHLFALLERLFSRI